MSDKLSDTGPTYFLTGYSSCPGSCPGRVPAGVYELGYGASIDGLPLRSAILKKDCVARARFTARFTLRFWD